ncbi:MAG: alpha/beta hydrolase [Thermoplasmata archaeon]|nr:alpha/beta hydrolase [Thermoplasmata archaeon]MCI4359901.1 alpha/beta hydrolase [Thermoplasmata archaeon]
MPTSSGLAPVEGGELYYEREGSGNPIVWLHGGFLDRRLWDPQFPRFSVRYDLLRYDQRGYGRSDRPTTEYAESFDLRHLLDDLGIASAYFVGLATGARIALDFAAAFPTRVDGLVAVAPTIEGYQPATPEEEALWEELDRKEDAIEALARTDGPERALQARVDLWAHAVDERTRGELLTIALENRARALREPNPFRQKLSPRTIDRLGAIRCPTLVVTGELDFPGFVGIANLLIDRLPIAQHSVVAGADHLVNRSQAESFNELLDGFFSRLDFILMQRGTTH